MKTFMFYSLLFVSFIGAAQNLAYQGTQFQHKSSETTQNTVKGIVLDSITQKPIPFASVLIKNIRLNTSEGVTCNEQGVFISNVSVDGEIEILASSVGFIKKNQQVKTDNSLFVRVLLMTDNKVLSEVKVIGDKPTIEEKVDRVVYNAEKDIATAGNMATDLLRKMPMISADLEGNVQVRGSSNFKVLIDGKPSVLATGNPSEVLKQIPAETIKSIELITSPSAKYDAEGAAIINVITKKKLMKGFSTNTNFGVGNKGSGGFLMMSYKKKKWAIAGNIVGNALYNTIDGYTETWGKVGSEKKMLIHQIYNGKFGAMIANAKVGVEYNLSEKDLISVNYVNRTKDFTNNRTAIADYFLTDSTEHLERYIQTHTKSKTNDLSLEYVHYFKKTQQELSITLLNSNNNNANVTNIDTSLEPKQSSAFNNDSYNIENVFQVDYQNPVKRNRFLELGCKLTNRQMNNRYSGNIEGINLNYAQNIYAGYVTYLYEGKKKWSLKSGLRLEHTANNFAVDKFSNADNYTNLFPSLAFIKKLSNARNFKINYNYRIQRPSVMYLNPAQSIADPLNTINGNPYILPEFTHNIESIYSTYIKANSLIITAFAKYINGPIGMVNKVNELGIVNTVFDNLDKQTDYGLNLYGSFKFTPKWQTIFLANLYYSKIDGGKLYNNLKNEGFSYTTGLMSTLDLANKWSIQLAGNFNSSRVQLQGRIPAFTYYNLSVKKGFKNSSVSLGIDNPFAQSISLVTRNSTSEFDFVSTMNLYARGLRLTFTHRFGKLTSQQESTKEKKGGYDLKQEESIQ